MPVKFKPSHKTFVKGRGTRVEHSYIKTISQKELFDYLNDSNGKPKIKQKVRNELTRRGIGIVYKIPTED